MATALGTVLLVLLLIQGVLGGFDTLYNHEWREHLPRHEWARTELGLHAMRESLYGLVFLAGAWFAWRGSGTLAIPALLAIETFVSLRDEAVENRTRVLPQNERVLHGLLMLNVGLLIAVGTVAGFANGGTLADGGWKTAEMAGWLLVALALSSFAWAIRDALAWRRWSLARAA